MSQAILAEVAGVPVEEFNRRRRDFALRGIADRFLVRYAGITQREVAAKTGAGSGGAISRQMRKVRELTASDRSLRRLLERAEKRIGKLRQTISKPKATIGSK